MKYGYARVSTDDQKADLQTAALKKAGCEHVFTDTASGSASKRPELARCLASLRAGDVLVVWKLDRLGRSLSHLVAVLSDLQGRGVAFLSLTEAIDTENAAGRLMGHIRRSCGVRAIFDRGADTGRTESGQATRPEAGAQAFAFGRSAQTCPRLAGQGRESCGGRQAAQRLPCHALQQLEIDIL